MAVTNFCLMLVAVITLGGCLPDDDSVREKKSASLNNTQAASYADSLATFSVSSQNTLANRFTAGAPLVPGVQGVSPNRMMTYAYCQQNAGGTTNHMMLAWYSTRTGANFTVKGLGSNSGSKIIEQLAQKTTPESIGVVNGDTMTLRGPRENGNAFISMASLTGCESLNIPAGAPVVLVENIQAPNLTVAASDSYEYKTERCSDADDIGAITYRKKQSETDWGLPYDNTCNGAVSTRAVTVASNNTSSLTGALDLAGSGNMQSTLAALSAKNKACRDAKYDENKKEDDGIDGLYGQVDLDAPKDFGTCDEEVEVIDYEGPGDNVLGKEIRREELRMPCGVGRTGTIPTSDAYNQMHHGSYRGPLNIPVGWQGSAVYERILYNADAKGGSGGHGDAAQWGPWKGKSLECDRDERLTLACSDAYPQYNDAVHYTPFTAGGIVMRRNNETRGWQDVDAMVPNDDKDPGVDWHVQLPSCRWQQNETFSGCPAGFTQETGGRYHREVKMLAAVDPAALEENNITGSHFGEWVSDSSLVCSFVQITTGRCGSTTTRTLRIIKIFPWSAPSQSVTVTTIENECGGGTGAGEGQDPLLFDLDGDGEISLLDMDEGVMFDMDDDGVADLTSWVGANDGILVMDHNGDGTINNHSEMFGDDVTRGFDHLAEYDSNDDGVIDSDDDAWGDLKIWRDANSDGVSQADELHSLSDFDVAHINLEYEETNRVEGDNTIISEGTFETIFGDVMTALDVAFSYISGFAQDIFNAARDSWNALFGTGQQSANPPAPPPPPSEAGKSAGQPAPSAPPAGNSDGGSSFGDIFTGHE